MNHATVDRARSAFQTAFRSARLPDAAVTVQAPGRVNLIGEHTDYNAGFVLPCAIDYATVITAAPRADRRVRVVAADYGCATDEFDLDVPIAHRRDAAWANYVRGMVQSMLQAGHVLAGADLAIAGDVPQGAGLSSSASLEVAVGQAFKSLQGLDLDPTTLALLAQRAENQFVGVNCGIMDQMISACGRRGHALLIDCRSLQAEAVAMPAGIAVMIMHSHVKRGLVDSEYNTRRRQCEAAATHYGVSALRDLSLAHLNGGAAGLDDVVLRRARHIVMDSQRAIDTAAALRAGDLRGIGTLFAASHASMRDDFEITHPHVDRLTEVAHAAIGGEGGSRMTGGGFGGCVVALMPQDRVDAVRAAVEAGYRAPDGSRATVWITTAADGTGITS